jgi:hypothetical protein
MGWLKTAVGWARDTWNSITGVITNPAEVFGKIWKWLASFHGLIGWLFGTPVLSWLNAALANLAEHSAAWEALERLLARIPAWIKAHLIMPWVRLLLARLARLQRWTAAQLLALRILMMFLYLAARLYARQLTAAEHKAMVTAVAREHKAMLAGLKATLAEVQKEAASGYNAGTPDRKTVIGKLLDDLAVRDPAVKHLVSDLIGLIIDIDTIDNPLARWLIQKLLAEIIRKLGVEKVIGDLLERLIGPLAGQPRATGLYEVTRDVARRLTALEAQWADFMTSGGPEVEQAGKEWKDLASIATDVGLLAFLGLAVADPGAWATGIADTAGPVANGAMSGIAGLLGRI